MPKSSILAGFVLALALCCAPASAQTLAQGFAAPPSDARPLVRWWWFGPAVEHEELAREIAAMRASGYGGFEIQPVYALALDNPVTGFRNREYMSAEFLEAVRFAAETGRAQGLRVDMTIGTGWPFGGPHIPVTQASAQIRMFPIAFPAGAREAALPPVGAGERVISVFLAEGPATAPDAANARALRFDPSAPRIAVTPANRERTLLAFVQSRTGQQVKRPAFGGEGFVLDHMNAAAVRNHIDTIGEPLVRAFGAHPPYAVFSDSLEAYGSDWTDDLLAEFQRRRGYDLAPRLPALFYDTPEALAIRHDWGLTLSELVDERYLTPLDAWARERNTRFRSQTYGIPPVTLSSNRLVALAEGEGADWRRFTSTRWATSANHLYGRTVSSAESWTWMHSPSFRATPLDIKAEADSLLLQGVNEFIAHGWPYSPPEAGEPGWAFYAAAVFNEHNPFQPVMPDVNLYLQRLSYLLRQGEPVADVAILIPTDDAFATMEPGRASVNDQMRTSFITDGLTQQILDAGYSFDYVDALGLEAEGFKHKVLILPRVTRIDPALYRRIAAFAARGGIVVAVDRVPEFGGGLIGAAAQAREVQHISSRLFVGNPSNGYQSAEADLGATLRQLTPPDLTGAPRLVGFVHRKLADGDLYFVVNSSNQPVRARIGFRAQSPNGQWWEPRTGAAHPWSPGEEIALAPYESRVFVFGAAASAPVEALGPVSTPPVIDLSRGWRVRFGGETATRTISAPHSWIDDDATRFFSGEAIYTRALTLTAAQIAAGQVVLHFGDGVAIDLPQGQRGSMALIESPVREAAEVFVNGRRAGSVWAPPYALDLGSLLRPGANQLEIRVTNTAINAMAGRNLPDYRLLNLRYGERFQMQDIANLRPLPSGILHAVTLTSSR